MGSRSEAGGERSNCSLRYGMIRKSVQRFSEEIMPPISNLKSQSAVTIGPNPIALQTPIANRIKRQP
jgi:hypothetical protein